MHFSAGSDIVLLTSQWYCQAVVLAVSLTSGQVVPITPVDTAEASYSLASIAGESCVYLFVFLSVCVLSIRWLESEC